MRPGTAIGVTAGTTTWALARYLREVPELTVVTNSIPVAEVMRHSGRTDPNVVLTGGLRTPSDALVGPVADAAIRSLHVDLLFMGVHGMDEIKGFTTPNLMEAETNRAFVALRAPARRRRRPHEVGRRRPDARWRASRDADILVTDDRLRPEARALLSEHVGELVLAPVATVGARTG